MEHPIENMMKTTMENIKDMVDVNTVIGDPVIGANDVTIIPVSRVSFGFVAGGGDYGANDKAHMKSMQVPEDPLPFAGGSGAGVSVQPVGFLVVGKDSVKMLPAQTFTVADRMVELLPQMVSDVKNMLCQTKADTKPHTMQKSHGNGEVQLMPTPKSGIPKEDLE